MCERLAFQRGSFIGERLACRKWASLEPSAKVSIALARSGDASVLEPTAVIVAPLPDGFWPRSMTDASIVAQHHVAKFDECLPVYRREQISKRQGVTGPRSTVCGGGGDA